MNKLTFSNIRFQRTIFLLAFLLFGMVSTPSLAQFSSGVTIVESQMSHRSWHITVKESLNLIGTANNDVAELSSSALDATSTWIVDDGPNDGKWWTTDKRYFCLKSASTGLYLTVQGSLSAGSPVGLDSLIKTDSPELHKQQFEIVAAPVASGWYRLKSRLGGYNLEVGSDGQIYMVDAPITANDNQRFAFNLALPSNAEFTYSIMGIHNNDFISDNGISTNNVPIVHKETHDYAGLWHFQPDGSGYYYIKNALTDNYLSNNGSTTAGDGLYANTSTSENAKWELIRDEHTFRIKNKMSGYLIGTQGMPADGQPVFQVTTSGIGIKWILIEIENVEPEARLGEYDQMPTTSPFCTAILSVEFKRAMAERAGLPADEAYYPLLLSAMTDYYDGNADFAEKALMNFELDNNGHRAELAYAVRQYLLGNVVMRSTGTWSPIETQAILYFNEKVQLLRVDYASRLSDAWSDFNTNYFSGGSQSFSALIDNLDAGNFAWPGDYDVNETQADMISHYISATKTFHFDNQELNLAGSSIVSTLASPAIAVGINILLYNQLLPIAEKVTNVAIKATHVAAIAATNNAEASVGLAASALANVGTVVTVVLIAAEIIAMEAMEVAEFVKLESNINKKILWASLPIFIPAIMQSHDELAKLRLLNDMDFLMGAPVENGFAYNFNNSTYFPAFDMGCQNITVSLDENCTTVVEPTDITGGLIVPFCGGGVDLSLSKTTFSANDIGQQQVTLTASNDEATKQCTAVITVVDNTPPYAFCQNIALHLDADGHVSTTAFNVDLGSFDACGSIQPPVLSKTSFDCSNVGANPVTLTVRDNFNNTSTCNATVFVLDKIAPYAFCQNIALHLDADGHASTTAFNMDLGSFDACGIQPLELSKASFDCSDVGANPVTLTVRDLNNNTSTCNATVFVVDNIAPYAFCQNIALQLDADGHASTTAFNVDLGSFDACEIQPPVLSKTSFDCSNVGANPVTLTVRDLNDNTSTCNATVFVLDHVDPTAICKNAIVQLDFNGNGSLAVEDLDDGSSDACGIQAFELSDVHFTCDNVGPNHVTLSITDNHGNQSQCSANVTVQDNLIPVALCQDVTVHLDASGNGATTAEDVNNGSYDACGIQSLALNKSSFDCSDIGASYYTLTVTDINNNSVGCSTSITVVDDTPPTISCPANRVVSNDPGDCSAVVNYEVTAADNCSSIVSQLSGYASGQPFPIGTTTNAFTATDAAGNEASCSFTVTVNKFGDPDLLYAYSLISMGDVKLKGNTIGAGGIGVVNAGKKVRLEQGTQVSAANSFVKSPQLDLQGGSSAQVYYEGAVDASLLPIFIANDNPGNNNLNVPDNSAPVTLGLGSYGKLEIGKNVTATFAGPASVFVKELKLKEGAILIFAQNTEVHVDKKMDLDKNSTIDKGGHTVWMYVEDGVSVSEGCDITANIFTQKDISVAKAKMDNQTYMIGLFIANGVDAKEYVNWTWDASQCPFTPPAINLNAGILVFNAQVYGQHEQPQVDLNWITTTSANDLRYEVEKSADGLQFGPVLEAANLHSDNGPHHYGGLDASPLEGNWTYRLKIVRKDGSVDYSAPQQLRIAFPESLTIFPNPANSTLNVSLKSFAGKAAELQIVNALGIVVQKTSIETLPEAPVSLSLEGLNDGIYTLCVKAQGHREKTIRFVVGRI